MTIAQNSTTPTVSSLSHLFSAAGTDRSLYIDGEWSAADAGATFEVRDPATGQRIASVADGTVGELRRAIDAAYAAGDAWAGTTAYERAAILERAHGLMRERADDLAHLMTLEQGKTLRAARTEVAYAADFLSWFAEEAKRTYGRTIPSARADQRFIVQHAPVGVVGAITPWNYPISMITRKIGPALAAGCTSVLKPASETPLCAVAVVALLEEAGVPKGVVNLVTSSSARPLGAELTSNPKVAKLTFTGSTHVGKQLNAAAAAHLKRVSMELGGHAPFLVLKDADPVRAGKGAAAIKLLNAGQACIVPNRYLVHRSQVEAFTQVLIERVGGAVVGNGFATGVAVGPLINQDAIDHMQAQVEDAVAKGATVRAGGTRLADDLSDGYFFAPTVLSDVDATMDIYRDETFGPIAPIISYDDEDDVIAMANDTDYGLASYIYTNDISSAFRVSERLKFGMVGINDINPTAAAAPFGGVKGSGLGREGAVEGLHEYLDSKLIGLSI